MIYRQIFDICAVYVTYIAELPRHSRCIHISPPKPSGHAHEMQKSPQSVQDAYSALQRPHDFAGGAAAGGRSPLNYSYYY